MLEPEDATPEKSRPKQRKEVEVEPSIDPGTLLNAFLERKKALEEEGPGRILLPVPGDTEEEQARNLLEIRRNAGYDLNIQSFLFFNF